MKKNNRFPIKLMVVALAIIFAFLILNLEVSTRQGTNYQCHILKLPLYLKIINFFDRHYNYKLLVKGIIKGAHTEEESVLKIFEWTHKNIRKAPEGFPVIDDHVWHIILRGYGTDDQSSDVFTTLCYYAQMDAFFSFVHNQNQTKAVPLSFIKVEEQWHIFDPYRGVYFENNQGKLAKIEEIKLQKARLIKVENIKGPELDYAQFFANLPPLEKIGFQRANIQSPLRRLLFELKKYKTKFRTIFDKESRRECL